MFERQMLIFNEENMQRIKNTNILLVGIGGVGGSCLEALVRLGYTNITIIDNDTFEESNLNRQLYSNINNISQFKVLEAEKRTKNINPNILLKTYQMFLDESNIDEININNYDYIIDACDSVNTKILLIKYAIKYKLLTSHYIENYYETNVPERDVWVNAISENLKNKGIETDLYLGNEIYMSENMMQLLIDEKASTINNSCYVLFEMPLNSEPMNLYNVIYSLQENKLIPVLAHPERYSFVQKEPELINDLIEKGVLMQANYGSILGYYGEKAQLMVKKFFENNMIHFLGSDVHRQNTIYKMIPEALEEIKEIVGKAKLEEMSTINPMLALKNKRIEVEEPGEVELTFKEKLIMYLKR